MPAREVLRHAAHVASQLAAGQHPDTFVDINEAPNAILTPTLADLETWAQGPLDEGVVVDVEDIGVLLGVGLCRVADLATIWVPIRTQGGALYWPADELPKVVEWLDHLLSTVPLIMHNGQSSDVPWLERLGFDCAGYEQGADTMLMAHLAWAEQPKGLQFLATLLLRSRNWKRLVKTDEGEGEGK